MATYAFRFGFIGFAQDPSTWYNQTALAIATLAPGLGDTILLNTPNGNLHGDAIVDQVIVAAPLGATPFTIGGSITAKQLTQSSALSLSAGAILTLLGRDTPAPPTTITAATSLIAATLAVNGPLAIQTGSLSAVQGSTVTANSLTLGTATLNLTSSSLAIRGPAADAKLTSGTMTTGIAHVTLSNNATLTTDGAISIGATGTSDLTATTGATIATNALTLGASGTGAAILTGATLNVAQRIIIGDAGTGTLTLNASTANAQDLAIALAQNARGTLTLAAGSSLQLQSALNLAPAGTALLQLTGVGTLLNSPFAVTFAGTGTTTLTLAAGAQAQFAGITAAATQGGVAAIVLDGTNTILTLAGPAFLGPAGNATLALTNGAALIAKDLNLGNARVSDSAATITAAQVTGTAQSNLSLVSGGTVAATTLSLAGSFTLATNSRVTANTASLAAATLTGGSTLNTDTLTLANALRIDSGGTVVTTSLSVAGSLFLSTNSSVTAATASLSAVTLTGGSTLKASTVALTDALTINSGGTLTATNLSLAGNLTLATNSSVTATTASIAAADLSGGSSFNVATLTFKGALAISGGATLSATNLSGTAPILVTGTGSRLILANQTTAPITLTQGATLSLPNITFGANTPVLDATSLITIGATTPQTKPGLTVASAAILTLAGTTVAAPITNAGIVSATNATLAAAAGSGTFQIAGGTLDIASFAGTAAFTNPFAQLRLRGLAGPVTVTNLQPGNVIDLPGQSGTLVGNTLTVGSYALTVSAAPTALGATAFRLDTLPSGTRLTAIDPLFDPAYYLARNPDVAAAGIDPYLHFATFGWAEGRNPSALFSISYYRATYADTANQNPLTQFEQSGWQSGRNPNPYFNTAAYLTQNPDVAAYGMNSLLHYQTTGWREGRNPSPQFSLAEYRAAYGPTTTDPLAKFLTTGIAAGQHAIATGPTPEPGFDPVYYYGHNPDVLAAGANAMQHWLSDGAREGRAPNAIFDPVYYSAHYADAGPDPLAQYIATGAAQGRDPSLLFSTTQYLLQNPDVAAAHVNPMLHYLNSGQYEGRMAFLSGPTAPADPLVQTAFYNRQLVASLIPTGIAANQQAAANYNATGWHLGLKPDAFFDTNYYLAHNPDVAAAHLNPLLHYENSGWREGRNPSASFDTRAYLSANPDVGAAGLNPLAHYLQFGQYEGRLPVAVRI